MFEELQKRLADAKRLGGVVGLLKEIEKINSGGHYLCRIKSFDIEVELMEPLVINVPAPIREIELNFTVGE